MVLGGTSVHYIRVRALFAELFLSFIFHISSLDHVLPNPGMSYYDVLCSADIQRVLKCS